MIIRRPPVAPHHTKTPFQEQPEFNPCGISVSAHLVPILGNQQLPNGIEATVAAASATNALDARESIGCSRRTAHHQQQKVGNEVGAAPEEQFMLRTTGEPVECAFRTVLSRSVYDATHALVIGNQCVDEGVTGKRFPSTRGHSIDFKRSRHP
jgi:hypothetical protein